MWGQKKCFRWSNNEIGVGEPGNGGGNGDGGGGDGGDGGAKIPHTVFLFFFFNAPKQLKLL